MEHPVSEVTVRASWVCLLAIAAPLAAQQPRAPARRPARAAAAAAAVRGPTVEGITEYDLANGLRVLLFPDSSKPTITVNITYLVGSRNEGYGETGMAHLLEHMVFKGTPHHRNIPQELTEHGAQPNGSTWFDRTNYFETFAATDSNLAWALDLESDRMVNSFIAKHDLESEMTVVRNEYEAGENDPFGVLMDRTLAAAFLWQNYGKSTIGARSDIERVPIERLQSFYHRYYQPDNAVLVVAGKFDPRRTLGLVERDFGRIPRPDRSGVLKIYPTYTVEPTQDGERSVTLRRVGDVQVVAAVYHVPAGSDSGFAAVDVLSQVLGSAPSGRLYRALVQTKKAADVGAMAFQLREPGVLFLYARVRQEDSLDSARVALERTVDSVLVAAPTAEEVERGKAALLRNIELNLNNSMRVGLQLSEWAAMGDWRLLFLYRDRLKAVTPADVQRVAARYLLPSNRTLGLFIPTASPQRSEIPPVPDVAALVRDYHGDTARAAGEAFDPSPENVEQRTLRSVLANGMRLALLPKRTRGQTVNAMLRLRYGAAASVAGKSAVGDLAADMLLRGSRRLTRQQIKDSLDRLQARVNVFGGPTATTVMVETTRPNFAAALDLLSEVLREPAFDSTEFRALVQENLATIEEQRSDPMARGFSAFRRHARGGAALLRRLLRRVQRGAGRGRGLRPGRGHAPRHGAPGRLEERAALRARAAALPEPARHHDRDRDPRQGQRDLPRRHEPAHPRRRSRLRGAGPRQLHAGRRVPELAAGGADPAEGRAQLRGRVHGRRGHPGLERHLHDLRDLCPAERAPSRNGLPRGSRPHAAGRVHRRGGAAGQGGLAPVARGDPGAGPAAREHADGIPVLPPHAGVRRRPRAAGPGAHPGADRRRDAPLSRSREVHDRRGG
jgi:zinc protease